jgi:hypothetical protein
VVSTLNPFSHLPVISTFPITCQAQHLAPSTYCLNSLTTGSQTIFGFLAPSLISILHLYCTSSFNAQSARRTGGFRGFPFGSTLIWVSRSLREYMGVAGAIIEKNLWMG